MLVAQSETRRSRAIALLALAGALAAGQASAEPSGKLAPPPLTAPPITAPMTATTQQPPQVINVKPDSGQPGWLKVCNKDPGGNNLCSVTRDFVSEGGKPLMAIALYEMRSAQTKQEARILRFLVPLGLILQPGIRVTVDGQHPTSGKFSTCTVIGCFSEVTIGPDALAALRTGSALKLAVFNQTQRELNFMVPLAGLGGALDGPAMTEEEQKKYQAEVARRAEEARRRQETDTSGAAPAADEVKPAPAAEAAPKP
ncbi:invasion protein IalB [Methylobacterium sp. BE186]|uniref:invasion associated locus B family protein n=1 Tax=Methylobacterium sp. BE186 TaxID=2817715 RepID=UPI0028612AF1|nr:invasion associated locus B family protein [Methylobacterium sp. BE186]MDR7036375.1 invasion protein IalB [Methylobacterium sp. BE186]